MVKVVEKPLDRLDPMFGEAPVRFAPKKPEHEASSIEDVSTGSRQTASEPKVNEGVDVRSPVCGRSV
jgi:hypothetical protein